MKIVLNFDTMYFIIIMLRGVFIKIKYNDVGRFRVLMWVGTE